MFTVVPVVVIVMARIIICVCGLSSELIGYTIVPMTGANTIYNNGLIEIFCQAPQGAHTIHINGCVKSRIAPLGGGLPNFIGGINGLSCPRGGTTTTATIVSRFLFCFNGYPGFTPGAGLVAIETTTAMAILIKSKVY